jgi:UDP-glucuronate decarboxylase
MRGHFAIIDEDVGRILGRPLPWNELGGATILITGAGGFLAAYIVETLLRLNQERSAGLRVVALVRNRERAHKRFARHLGRPDLQILEQDAATSPVVEGPVDFIVHAASQASPKYFGVDPVGTLLPNVIGTHHLLALARERHSRGMLFISSGEVYGRVRNDQIPIGETVQGLVDPTDVRSCYAESKRMAETMCVAWSSQFGVPAVIARPFHTYGPGFDLNDGRVFADFVADVVEGRNLVLRSDGTARRAFCYLADATEGFLTVLLRGEAGQAYNVGNSDAEVSIRELAELLAGLFPDRGLRVVHAPREGSVNYLQSPISRNSPDVSKLKCLGWSPNTTLPDGFRRTVQSFL